MNNIYKPIRDGPDSISLLVWSYVENLMLRRWKSDLRKWVEPIRTAIPLMGLVWMSSGYREAEIRGNDLSGSWHWQAVMSGDSVIE